MSGRPMLPLRFYFSRRYWRSFAVGIKQAFQAEPGSTRETLARIHDDHIRRLGK